MTTWQINDPLFLLLHTFDLEDPANTEEDMKLRPQLQLCTANHMEIWLGERIVDTLQICSTNFQFIAHFISLYITFTGNVL
jgi:hypothetical protein